MAARTETLNSPHWYDEVIGDREPLSSVDRHKLPTLSEKQRSWLKRAWSEYYNGKLPDTFAVHAADCGEPVVCSVLPSGAKIEFHHITPSQDALAHGENPNCPENLIPLPKRSHTGVSESSIHPDISDARSRWHTSQENGEPNPFTEVVAQHERLAAAGIPYWNTQYDDFFRELAGKVVSAYRSKHPDDPWPETRKSIT